LAPLPGASLLFRPVSPDGAASVTVQLSFALRTSDGSRLRAPCRARSMVCGGLDIPVNTIPILGLEYTLMASGPGFASVKVKLLDWQTLFDIRVEVISDQRTVDEKRRDEACPIRSIAQGSDGFGTFSIKQARQLATPAADPSRRDLLANPYALRDWMRNSAEGERLIELYERHGGEIVRLVSTNAPLFNESVGMLREFMPGLNQFLSGTGVGAVIRPDLVDQVNRVWDTLAAAGSPELKEAIQAERAHFHGLQDFVGRSFAEWGKMLGWNAPSKPFLHISNPRREGTALKIEANHIAGQQFTLWSRAEEPGASWKQYQVHRSP